MSEASSCMYVPKIWELGYNPRSGPAKRRCNRSLEVYGTRLGRIQVDDQWRQTLQPRTTRSQKYRGTRSMGQRSLKTPGCIRYSPWSDQFGFRKGPALNWISRHTALKASPGELKYFFRYSSELLSSGSSLLIHFQMSSASSNNSWLWYFG